MAAVLILTVFMLLSLALNVFQAWRLEDLRIEVRMWRRLARRHGGGKTAVHVPSRWLRDPEDAA